MQRVSAFLPSWDKRNSGARGKPAAGGLSWWSAANSKRASANGPSGLAAINTSAANSDGGRVHREAFWPATLDAECDKAARILKSFCCDGYLAPADDENDTASSDTNGPRTPVRLTKKIPRRIIQNAAGIAVFTCMRNGLWMTGSGGSGILIARKSDGTWSPPSGIMLHTPTLSFIIGVDVYDCVLVINNLAALESLTRPRLTLGEDVGLTGGPLVSLDSTESEIAWKDLGNTVLTYLKARGQHQVVNLNGCILTERGNENERFYHSDVSQMDILSGNVARHVEETGPLFDVIKMAEGRTDFNQATIDKIATEPAPGDAVIATPKSTPASPRNPRNAFGIPAANDPDPFGVLALEMAGLEIREAGTRLRPASSQLDFTPPPLSPAVSKFNRQSVETFTTKSNRGSYMSTHTAKSQVTDAGTQTDVGKTPVTTPSPGQSEDGVERASFDRIPEAKEDDEVDYTTVDLTPLRHLSQSHAIEIPGNDKGTTTDRDSTKLAPAAPADGLEKASEASSVYDKDDDEDGHETNETNDADDEDDEDDDEEEPVIFEVAQVQPTRTQAVASRMIHAKGSMVTIPKRVPPPLPARSAARLSRSSRSEMSGDVASLKSPLRYEFSETDVGVEKDDAKSLEAKDGAKDEEVKIEITADGAKPGDVKTEEQQPTDIEVNDSKTGELEAKENEIAQPEAEDAKPTEIEVADSDTGNIDAVVEEKKTRVEQSKTADVATEDTTAVDSVVTPPNIDRPKSQDVKMEESPKESDEEDSRIAETVKEQSKTEETDLGNLDAEESRPEKHEIAEAEEEDSKDDASFKTPPSERSDNSDSTSHMKHTSSIFTGATEDRWSVDGSSLTTPTSDRPFSALDDAAGEDTPTKEKDKPELTNTELKETEKTETTPAVTAS